MLQRGMGERGAWSEDHASTRYKDHRWMLKLVLIHQLKLSCFTVSFVQMLLNCKGKLVDGIVDTIIIQHFTP